MPLRRRALVGVALLVLVLLLAVVALEWPSSAPDTGRAPPTVAKVARHRPAPPPRAGVAPHALGVAPGSEEAPPLPAATDTRAAVYGRVHGAEKLPDGAVQLEGCGVMPFDGVPVDASGEFFTEVEAGQCQMRAWRMQGALRLPGPWVELDTVGGVDANVDLSVPDFEPAGMGITFRATPDGVFVLDARPGTPAAEAGLEHGDRILLIDGDPTSDMQQEDFLTHGIGPAGTSVHLEGVTADGEPFDVTMIRRPIHVD